ncbi:MAG: NAD(P)-dependent oxidoreductase [Acidobacteriota bacterium]
MKVLLAESEGFSAVALRRLRTRAEVIEADLRRHELLDAVADAEVLWVRLRTQIDREVFAAAPGLRVLVSNTTGLNHIDLDEARTRGVHVISLRGEVELLRTVRGTAELTLGLALALVRQLPAASAHVVQGGWNRYQFKGHDLYEKTAGIVGYGRLGRIVASYFRALGMRVVATTRDTDPVPPSDQVDVIPLDALLREADLVSVHVDLNPETRGMFGPDQFAAIKPGAWFVNTSRGEVVDEMALLAALTSGRLRGAALDVVSDELSPGLHQRPLLRYAATHDNLLVTPHIGGYTFESLARTEDHLAGRLLDYLELTTGQSVAVTDVVRP